MLMFYNDFNTKIEGGLFMSIPGGEISGRPLHVIWIVDCSGSMSGDKIQSLNNAIRNSIPYMRKVAEDNPFAKIFIRVITFSDKAHWHVANPIPVENFTWIDLQASGQTAMGDALRMVAQQLSVSNMPDRALPPLLILISDGQPTDDFDKGLRELMNEPWGLKAVRIAIGIGEDADYEVLERFIGNKEIPVLRANNAETLTNYIRWVSTTVLKETSSPSSVVGYDIGKVSKINIPTPPPSPTSSTDVW